MLRMLSRLSTIFILAVPCGAQSPAARVAPLVVPWASSQTLDSTLGRVLNRSVARPLSVEAPSQPNNRRVKVAVIVGATAGTIVGGVVGYSLRVGCRASAPPPGVSGAPCRENDRRWGFAFIYGGLGGVIGAGVGGIVAKLVP